MMLRISNGLLKGLKSGHAVRSQVGDDCMFGLNRLPLLFVHVPDEPKFSSSSSYSLRSLT